MKSILKDEKQISMSLLLPMIKHIISTSDLDTLSRKSVRKLLEKKHGDLTFLKMEINDAILNQVEKCQQQAENGKEESEASEDEEISGDEESENESEQEISEEEKVVTKPKGRGGAFNALLSLSPELATFLKTSNCSRPVVVKKIWAYIKENDLQDPSDRRRILLDDDMETVFGRKTFTMFSMNKYLTRHLQKPENLTLLGGWEKIHRDGESSEEDEEKNALKARKKADKKVLKKRKLDNQSGDKKVNTAFNAPQKLSGILADFIGQAAMSRPQVVKALWVYIKKEGLQNPENKREIICDGTFEKIMGRAKVTMFTMNTYLKVHFLGKAEEGDIKVEESGIKAEEAAAAPCLKVEKQKKAKKVKVEEKDEEESEADKSESVESDSESEAEE